MAPHDRIRIQKPLHLEQRLAAPIDIRRPGLAQHQPLAALCADVVEHVEQVLAALALGVREHVYPADAQLLECLLNERDAVLKRLVALARAVEDLVADAELPCVRVVLRAHDGDAFLEVAAGGEEFAVEADLSSQSHY